MHLFASGNMAHITEKLVDLSVFLIVFLVCFLLL